MPDFMGWRIRSYPIENELRSGIYTFLNPYSYCVARKSAAVFEKFDGIMLDGILSCLAFRMFRIANVRRQSFDNTSLAPTIFSQCIRAGLSVALIGSKRNEIFAARQVIISQFPDLDIVYVRDGYFSSVDERAQVISELSHLAPDVVIVGMGAKLQEAFLVDLREMGWDGIGFTCGGFFHQTARAGVHYYPGWIDAMNMRWLYRMWDEPALIVRYLKYYPLFLFFLFFDWWRYR